MDLTLVIPAKKEKESLPYVLEELKKYNYKCLIVLEKNDTETIESINNYDCEIIYQNNLGYGSALIQGINATKTEYFCIFNADGSFIPNEIKQMKDELEKNNLDYVFGSRYQKGSKSDDDTLVTLIGNYFFTYFGKIFFNLNITDILYTFVIGKTKKAKELNLKKKDFTFCVELPIKAKRLNQKMTSYTSHERSRIAGSKKVNAFKDGFYILIYLFKIFFRKEK